ncbi:MAG: ATP phosphoribosyltransferase regulatory subunit [bacterium]|nr:ATP phosphoribosyltransferase regulatory subunit [bacterium]
MQTTKTIKKPVAQTKPGSLNGLRDIVTQTSPHWDEILKRLQTVGRMYGFKRVETPIVEEEKVYLDYYKEQPQALQKIVFTQLGNKSIALRSSVLPSILRYYVQHKIFEEQPLSKWFYAANIIEQDERQAIHSNYQYGFEVLGSFNHLTEAQVISAVWDVLQRLGLSETQLEINTVGDAATQTAYQNVLKDYLKGKEFELCEDCTFHLSGRLLNILRCNKLDCQLLVAEAPAILDFLDAPARKQFTDTLEALDELGMPYQLNQFYVGPEGTSRTSLVFKYKVGNETVVLGEGSYHELLLKNVAGKPMPAFGFTGSLSAMARAMELAQIEVQPDHSSEVFLVPLGELASKKSLRLFRDLVAADVRVYDHFGTAGVKNQLKQAEEYKSPIALIMGQKEAMDEMVILRDVKSGMQEIFSYDKIIDEVKKRLGR